MRSNLWVGLALCLFTVLATAPNVVLAAGPVAATAAAPTLTEGSANSFSSDLAGNVRVTQGTLTSGEGMAGIAVFSPVT